MVRALIDRPLPAGTFGERFAGEELGEDAVEEGGEVVSMAGLDELDHAGGIQDVETGDGLRGEAIGPARDVHGHGEVDGVLAEEVRDLRGGIRGDDGIEGHVGGGPSGGGLGEKRKLLLGEGGLGGPEIEDDRVLAGMVGEAAAGAIYKGQVAIGEGCAEPVVGRFDFKAGAEGGIRLGAGERKEERNGDKAGGEQERLHGGGAFPMRNKTMDSGARMAHLPCSMAEEGEGRQSRMPRQGRGGRIPVSLTSNLQYSMFNIQYPIGKRR